MRLTTTNTAFAPTPHIHEEQAIGLKWKKQSRALLDGMDILSSHARCRMILTVVRSLIPAALFPVYQRDALTAQMRLDAFDEPVHIAIEVRVGSDLNAVAIGERL